MAAPPGLRALRWGWYRVIEYLLPGSGGRIILSRQVLQHMAVHRQTRLWHREAGGQLFGTFAPGAMVVERITGPRGSDKRSRTAYHPDRAAEQREIHDMHVLGFHYAGDWHTHPEKHPSPSRQDRNAMVDMFANSRTEADGFLLVVVGTADPPRGLHASWVSKSGMVGLPVVPARTMSKVSNASGGLGDVPPQRHPLFG